MLNHQTKLNLVRILSKEVLVPKRVRTMLNVIDASNLKKHVNVSKSLLRTHGGEMVKEHESLTTKRTMATTDKLAKGLFFRSCWLNLNVGSKDLYTGNNSSVI